MPQPESARRIVVICPNWVGDLVMATPLLASLRQAFAAAHMAGVLRGYVRGVLEPNPWFDELITAGDKTAGGFIELVRRLQRLRPELAVVLPNSIRAALIARLGFSRRVIGYRRGGRGPLLSGGPAPPRQNGRITPVPMVHHYLDIARWMGVTVPQAPRPEVFISEEQRRRADALMADWGIGPGEAMVGLNPGARFGSSKCWPPEHFARLAEMLVDRWGCRVVLFIGPGEEPLGERIAQLSRVPVVNTGRAPVDLATLKPLVARCRLLITNDTGPRHYAVALGVPAVVMMGPTDPRYTQANLERTAVLRRELDCVPCHARVCPRDHACMAGITPEEVMAAAERLISEESPTP